VPEIMTFDYVYRAVMKSLDGNDWPHVKHLALPWNIIAHGEQHIRFGRRGLGNMKHRYL
jgi:hypothetical protein